MLEEIGSRCEIRVFDDTRSRPYPRTPWPRCAARSATGASVAAPSSRPVIPAPTRGTGSECTSARQAQRGLPGSDPPGVCCRRGARHFHYARRTDRTHCVKPTTVVKWHRTGFRTYWRQRSPGPGRPKTSDEIRDLIRLLRSRSITGARACRPATSR
jgi:hypothetical protein